MGESSWEPTMHLRYAKSGQLQQQWTREVREWKKFGGKEYLCRRYEHEWRDISPESESEQL